MSMHYYKATIQYIGTNYAGFQWQSGLQTVQSEINQALAELIKGKVTTIGASRTDTGVHACEQVVKITSESTIDFDFAELNKKLSTDIRCRSLIECSGDFKPGPQAESKEYRYLFTNKTHPHETKLIANVANSLNLEAIQECIETLKGTHDFCNFYSSGSNVKSTIRNIIACELNEINPHDIFSNSDLFIIPQDLTACFQLQIKANGFLKQMIRHIVSALWMVGSGKMTAVEFKNYLNGPKATKQLWKVAPPNGLYLYKINYP